MLEMKQVVKTLWKRWELVYSTPNVSKHFAMLQRLDNQGLKYKTKTISFGGGFGGGEGFSSVYHIYVPKDIAHHAGETIHSAAPYKSGKEMI